MSEINFQPPSTNAKKTEERTASDLLEERLRDLLQGVDAIIWEMDAQTWQFTFVSDRAEDILGYPIQQWLEEKNFWQNRLLHPEDRDWCVNFCVTATQEARDHQFQYRAIATDGRIVWLKDLVRIVCDENGCAKLLRGVMVDISAERKAEASNQQLLQERAERAELQKIQDALRKSEERYRFLVQAISQIIWDTKAEGEFVTEQPGWSAFTGQTFDELKGSGWLNAIHPDDREHTAAVWSKAVATRTLYQVEHRLRRYDGEYRYMSVRAVPVLESDGTIREWIGVHTDISDRKQVENALKESEHRYAQILDSVQDMIFCKSPNFTVVYANKAACEYYGMNREQLCGITDVSFNDQDYTNQYIGDDFLVFSTGQTIEILEEPNRRSDGEVRFFHTIKSPIFDINGNVVELVGVSRDITQRKHEQESRENALAAAQAARAELQRVFMQAPAAISTSRGPTHIIETANPLYLQIINHRECLGKPAREAFPELRGQGFFELLDQVYSSGQPFVGKEMRALVDREGNGILTESFWNFVYQPLLDSQSQVYGIMTHAVEVTDQVRARQEIEKKAEQLAQLTTALERTNHELEQFAYVTSHDLKAPLRGIASLSEWIEEEIGESITPESQEYMNLLRGRVHRMEALIDGILDYSRAGKQEILEVVNVNLLLSELIELLAPPDHVTIDIQPNLPILKTERVPLQQVFMNLINNAIKYGKKENLIIQISAQKVGKFYHFSVADNGVGIAPKYHQKIWGIFQRLEARDKVEGTGIGLSVVKKIVENRGGKIWVESAVDAGATFFFTWPKKMQN